MGKFACSCVIGRGPSLCQSLMTHLAVCGGSTAAARKRGKEKGSGGEVFLGLSSFPRGRVFFLGRVFFILIWVIYRNKSPILSNVSINPRNDSRSSTRCIKSPSNLSMKSPATSMSCRTCRCKVRAGPGRQSLDVLQPIHNQPEYPDLPLSKYISGKGKRNTRWIK